MGRELLKRNIIGGLPLENHLPEMERCLLFGVTEMHREEHMDKLVRALKEVYHV